MMVSETAAFAGGQASYLQQVQDAVSQSGAFPLIKAVLYFDAPGDDGNNSYPLNTAGWQSTKAFGQRDVPTGAVDLGRRRHGLSGGDGRGARVRLTAAVSNSDFGGSVSFEVNELRWPDVSPSRSPQ